MNKLKEILAKAKEAAEKAATDIIPFEKVPEEIQIKRMDICRSCEYLYTKTDTCKLCGCFMGVKTWMATQECPKKKWRAISGPQSALNNKD